MNIILYFIFSLLACISGLYIFTMIGLFFFKKTKYYKKRSKLWQE